jgi:energy-coupling factor transporter ATP-binding protein EcfA2
MSELSLETVTIDGFRALKNVRLDGLGLINVLVGANGSGKTSVLEALSILCNAADPTEWISMVRRRDFGGLDETRILSLRWCFRQSGSLLEVDDLFQGECSMTCTGRFPLKNLRVTCEEIEGVPESGGLGRLSKARSVVGRHGVARAVDGRDLDLEPCRGAEITHYVDSDGSLLRSGTLIPDPVSVRVWEDNNEPARHLTRTRSRAPTETLTPYSYQINRLQVRHYSQNLIGRQKSDVLDLVREFEPEIADINLASVRGVRPSIYLEHKRLGYAPLSVFGDALRRAVLLAATTLSLKDGGVLLIDEIETGIHVSTLKRVLAWLTRVARDLRVQVVATTHSLEALDAIAIAAGDAAPDLVTFHLDRLEERTRVKRIDRDLLLRLRHERGLDVR